MFGHRSLTACAFGELSVLANFRPTSISTNLTGERRVFVVRLYGIVLSLHMLMCMCSRHKLLQAFARFAHVFGTYP